MSISSVNGINEGKNASAENEVCQCHGGDRSGTIRVIGIGPGHEEEMTPKAIKAMEASDIIVGYNTYIALVKDLIKDKEVVGNGMRQEVDRCQKAVDLAAEGHQVAVISSGDPGVYGMSGLVLELIQKLPKEARPECEVIPGLTAANTSAAALGAPLMTMPSSVFLI